MANFYAFKCKNFFKSKLLLNLVQTQFYQNILVQPTWNFLNKEKNISQVISRKKYILFHKELNSFKNLLKRSNILKEHSIYWQFSRKYSSPPPDKNPDDENNKKNLFVKVGVWLFIAFLFIATFSALFPSSTDNEANSNFVSWHEFVNFMLVKGEVQEIVVRPDMNIVTIVLYPDSIFKGKRVERNVFHMTIDDVAKFETKLRQIEASFDIRPDDGVTVVYNRSSNKLLRQFVTVAIVIGVLAMLFKNLPSNISLPSQFSMSRAKFTIIDPLLPGTGKGVKFADVAGCKEAKQEVMEFVDFLKNPQKYQRLGAKIPKGALLLGPPGCGKTLLAKAVATEGMVPFLAMNGSEFVEMIGGVGAARVRDLFKEAKKRAPCIIYIDELDAIGRQRAGSGTSMDGGSQEGEQTLNQLLVEMDGILSKEGVVLLASTNRLDILDKALLRPGRFDRHIMMELPTQDERRQIFDHHLKSVILESSPASYSKRLAALTLGFSGADIANVVNEAALYAARNGKKKVGAGDLEYAIERIVGGIEKKTQTITNEERRVVAYHEAGHALVGWLLEHTDALLKVTILPRTSLALGFAQYAPKERKLHTYDQLFEKMCMALGGRVAESLTFNRVTTGAQNDLEKVTKMAYAQVRSFGFSDAVGQLSFPEEETRNVGRRPYSKRLASLIDSEVQRIIFEAYKATENLLKENKDKLEKLAESLLKKETLNYEDIETILGSPKYPNKDYVEPIQFENEINEWNKLGEEQPPADAKQELD